MGNGVSGFQGPAGVAFTSIQEAQAGWAHDGQTPAPPGSEPVVIEPGDTLSGVMAAAGQDWNNPEQREQFLRDNPQFTETGGRNPDLIWPGEVVYVRSASPSQATDQAIADLQALEQQHGETSPGSSVNAAEHRSEVYAQGGQAVEEAVKAELAAGATADQIIERHGGANVSPRVEAAIREAATDYAAQQLLAARQSGDPGAIEQAQAALNEAISNEISADAYELAPRDGGQVNREAHGQGAIAAGNAIATRLENMGVTGQASTVQQLAQAVSDRINNEV